MWSIPAEKKWINRNLGASRAGLGGKAWNVARMVAEWNVDGGRVLEVLEGVEEDD